MARFGAAGGVDDCVTGLGVNATLAVDQRNATSPQHTACPRDKDIFAID